MGKVKVDDHGRRRHGREPMQFKLPGTLIDEADRTAAQMETKRLAASMTC
ncbi:hypothetical protein [Bradyrhizobium sp. MOS002]|nr:hypothetical protein [Bradyrhizobium sp. MOS002]